MCSDPCDFATCGANAQCVSGNSTNGTFDCVCNPGFTGDPFISCFGKPYFECASKTSHTLWRMNTINHELQDLLEQGQQKNRLERL